jgi:hypothetical protein|tara:strand:+ start:2593 stop:2796 length:204 start_codon:yes stop_codon:yes gene_type:complete
MNQLFDFTTKLLELSVAVFALMVVSSVLFGFNVMTPTLEWLNNSSNLLNILGVFVIYTLFKGELQDD